MFVVWFRVSSLGETGAGGSPNAFFCLSGCPWSGRVVFKFGGMKKILGLLFLFLFGSYFFNFLCVTFIVDTVAGFQNFLCYRNVRRPLASDSEPGLGDPNRPGSQVLETKIDP